MNKLKIDQRKKHLIILVLLAITAYIVFCCCSESFRKITNFYTILRSMSVVSVIALGVTFVITLGEIDLSIQTVPGLCAAVFCYLIEAKTHIILALLAALAVGVAIGAINGMFVVRTKLPSFIVTLATGMIVGGLSEVTTAHRAIVISLKGFTNTLNFRIGHFPGIALWMLLFAMIAYVLMNRTRVGRYIEMVGDNREAARYAGIRTRRYMMLAFLICSTYCFIGGMLGVSVSSNATPDMLREYLMTAIAATVIGGTDMAGGRGSVIGTIVGAFFLSTVENGFLILGIQQWVLYLVNGVVILMTLSLKEIMRVRRNGSR